MKNSASVSANIFDELFVTVESIGVEKTIQTLQEARSKKLILSDLNIENIINFVVEVTGVQKERILNGKDRSDERKMATALCVHYIKNELGYSFSDLKKIFNKDEAGLYRYNEMVKCLPKKPKTEFDVKLSEFCKKLELLITSEKIK